MAAQGYRGWGREGDSIGASRTSGKDGRVVRPWGIVVRGGIGVSAPKASWKDGRI